MAAGEDGIDLYADVGEDFGQGDQGDFQDADLYDDVITAPSSNDNLDGPSDRPNPPVGTPVNYTGKRVSLYVGNLTWWTTDQDLTDAITSLGITDLLEIKFYENRVNGQSKGFATVVFGSDSSSRICMEKMPRKELHGQNPVVTRCNRQALNQFENASRKDDSRPAQNGEGFSRNRDQGGNRHQGNRGPPLGGPGGPGPGPGPGGFGHPGPGPGQRPPQGPPPGPRGPPPGPGGPLGPGPGPGGPPPFGPGQGPPPRQGPPGPGPNHGPPRPGMGPGVPPRDQGPPPGMGGPPRFGLPSGPPGGLPGGPPRGPGPGPMDVRGPPPGPRPEWTQPPPPGAGGPFNPSGPPPGGPPQRPPSGPPQGPPPVGHGGPPPNHGPPPGHTPAPAPHVNPAFFPPASSAPPSGIPVSSPSFNLPPQNSDPYGRPSTTPYPVSDPYRAPERSAPPNYPSSSVSYERDRHDVPQPQISEAEFDEILQRNKTVSSSAISRAVQDASAGEYASAIETLVTAISLIKQSKIANDDRCKILISSLQDTLHGIESKSYGSKSSSRRSRSRSRERERERSEKRSRHRSREREYRDRSRERESRHYDMDRHRERERERDRDRDYRSSRH